MPALGLKATEGYRLCCAMRHYERARCLNRSTRGFFCGSNGVCAKYANALRSLRLPRACGLPTGMFVFASLLLCIAAVASILFMEISRKPTWQLAHRTMCRIGGGGGERSKSAASSCNHTAAQLSMLPMGARQFHFLFDFSALGWRFRVLEGPARQKTGGS